MRNDRGNRTAYGAYPGEPFPPGRPLPEEPYAAPGYPPPLAGRSSRTVARLGALLAVVFLLLIMLQLVLFRLQTVYVIGNSTIDSGYIVSLTGLKKGDSIFSVNEDDVRSHLEADHWIVLSHMFKQYPNVIYLFVNERRIAASMQWLGIEYTLDIDGMVLEEYSDMDFNGKVPTVYGFRVDNALVGKPLAVRSQEQLRAYSAIVSELTIQRYADRVVSINVGNTDSLSLLTTDGITVQFGNGDYMRAKIGAMRTDIA